MDNSFGVLEAEIAELQKKIDEKKNILESQGGIVEEKAIVSEAVEELFIQPVVNNSQTTASSKSSDAGDKTVSYLDNLDPQTTESITALIERIPQVGIAKVVGEASLGNPYLIDALHDALVDKLYEELLARGIVSSK